MNDDLKLMYDWVKRTREVLFEYTESLPNDIYTLEHPDFVYGSIRDIHAHVAVTYQWWVGHVGLKRPWIDLKASSIPDVKAMRKTFLEVDAVVEAALEQFKKPDEPLAFERPGRDALQVTGRWLIMHPVTHEFHHKGQLLTLGRALGYPLPPTGDTDLVLPD
jgi:uncharacterized damage-inducible protein DinB